MNSPRFPASDASKSCCHASTPTSKWYKDKNVQLILFTFGVIGLSYAVPFLTPFRLNLFEYFPMIWGPVVVGLLIGGMIEHFVPKQYISATLAGNKQRTILHAVGLGFLMSACCHGILAIAIQLYKKGASTSSVVAFLLASPWANMTMTLMLIGFFGIAKSLYIVAVAIFIAMVTGFIFQYLERKALVEQNPHALTIPTDFSIGRDFVARLKQRSWNTEQLGKDLHGILKGTWALGQMIGWWLMIGLLLAAAIGSYVPHHFFQTYLNANLSGLILTLVFATVIEVCSEGSVPITFELFKQTGALGNVIVFLMAGVATDYTEIAILWQNIGRRTALWLPLLTIPQIILFALLANWIF